MFHTSSSYHVTWTHSDVTGFKGILISPAKSLPVEPLFCNTLQGDGSDDDVEDWEGLHAAFEWRPNPAEMGMIDRFFPKLVQQHASYYARLR